jgi:integrase
MNSQLASCFGTRIEEYITLKQQLGLKFGRQSYTLAQFDLYLQSVSFSGLLTQDIALAFATQKPDASANEHAWRYGIVRRFSQYLSAYIPEIPCMDPHALTLPTQRPTPYIFTEDQIREVLHLAKTLPHNPIRRITLHAMIALAATTGMRLGEVARLNRADVDLTSGILHIQHTKFNKERLVPVHPTTLTVLNEYARVRDVTYPYPSTPAFFISMYRTRVANQTLAMSFRDLLEAMGFSYQDTPHPTFHSLRHTFAVRRLETWYAEGKNVQALLPSLATYMGHVHYTDTAYYITATPQLLALAAARADAAWLSFTDKEVQK